MEFLEQQKKKQMNKWLKIVWFNWKWSATIKFVFAHEHEDESTRNAMAMSVFQLNDAADG